MASALLLVLCLGCLFNLGDSSNLPTEDKDEDEDEHFLDKIPIPVREEIALIMADARLEKLVRTIDFVSLVRYPEDDCHTLVLMEEDTNCTVVSAFVCVSKVMRFFRCVCMCLCFLFVFLLVLCPSLVLP